jgi:hypothetical protein
MRVRASVPASLLAFFLAALALGCGKRSPPPRTPGRAACGDPCAAMTCPAGNQCSWNDSCQPRCDPPPLPVFSR